MLVRRAHEPWNGLWCAPSGFCEHDEHPIAVIAVAYYHAEPVDEHRGAFDRAEISDARWFAWKEMPQGLAPPSALPSVLIAWREAHRAGETATPLRDRPSRRA